MATAVGFVLGATQAMAEEKAAKSEAKSAPAAAPAEGGTDQAGKAAKPAKLKSSEIRATKSYGVYVEPVGFTMTMGQGIRGEYLLSESNVISVGFASGKYEEIAVQANSIFSRNQFSKLVSEVRFKRFLGNSFYAALGLGMENWTIDYYVKKKDSTSEDIKVTGTNSNMGATLHVGNQWTWKYVAVGVDWAGYFYAFSSNFTPGKSDETDSDAQESADASMRKTTFGSSAHAVRVYVGTMF